MSIRTKTVLIITGIIALVFSAIAFAASYILSANAYSLEQTVLATNVDRVYQAYSVTLDALNTKLSDWSIWDDTFNFIHTKSRAYIDANLSDESLENLKVDVMVFMDAKGNVVYDKTHRWALKQTATTSTQLIEEMSSLSRDLFSSSGPSEKKGLLRLSEGQLLFSLQPVVKSDGTGPADGTILFGEYFDDGMTKALAKTTKLEIEIHRLDQPLSQVHAGVVRELENGKSIFVINHTPGAATAYRLLSDVYGKPALLVGVTGLGDFYQQSLVSIRLIIGGFLLAGAVFLIAIIIILNRIVLSPIIFLRNEVAGIGKNKGGTKRLTRVSSRDEIGELAGEINRMLQSIEEEKMFAQTYINTVGFLMIVIGRDGLIQNINSKGCEILGYLQQELIGKNWFDTCISERDRALTRTVFDKLMKGEVENTKIYDNNVLTRDGKEKMLEWHNAVLRDTKGEIVGTVSMGQDISKQLQEANQAISHAEELEKVNRLMVGRELKMVELKKQVEELEKRLAEKGGV